MKFELLEVAGTHIFSMKAMTLVLFFIFAIIVVGYLVGKISIKGVSLGSAAIFLVALVAGHFKGGKFITAFFRGGFPKKKKFFSKKRGLFKKIVEVMSLFRFLS